MPAVLLALLQKQQTQAGRCCKSTWHHETSAGERCALGYGDPGRLWAGCRVQEMVRSKALEKKTNQPNPKPSPKYPKDLELFRPEKTGFGQELVQPFYECLRWSFSSYFVMVWAGLAKDKTTDALPHPSFCSTPNQDLLKCWSRRKKVILFLSNCEKE